MLWIMRTCFLSLIRAFHKNTSIKKSKEKRAISPKFNRFMPKTSEIALKNEKRLILLVSFNMAKINYFDTKCVTLIFLRNVSINSRNPASILRNAITFPFYNQLHIFCLELLKWHLFINFYIFINSFRAPSLFTTFRTS